MSIDIDMAEIAQLFIEESMEGLDIMETGLLNLDLGAADPETMNAIFRAAHSIKGGGATFGFTEVSGFAHHVETLLDEMRQGQRAVTREGVDLMLLSVDCIRDMIASVGSESTDMTRAIELEAELERMLHDNVPFPSAEEDASTGENAPSANIGTSATLGSWSIDFKPLPGILKSCNDPLRIFRELQTLGDLEVHAEGAEALLFKKIDAEECHLSWQLQLLGTISREQVEEVFAWVKDESKLSIVALDLPTQISGPAAQAATANGTNAKGASAKSTVKATAAGQESSSIRVNIDKVDALINLVGELVITQLMLARFNGEFGATDLGPLRQGLSQLTRNTRDLQESVMAIRMLPMSFAFSRFPRLVRDTGIALGKQVELRLAGENTELDKTVLEKIGDPLVHLVRNSLDHGLETVETRIAAGKPETGVLELNAFHQGGNIVIEVSDDGAGINKEKVLTKARAQGIIEADEDLSDDQLNNLIFRAGFSTVDEVSDLSGRGVGMDVVRRNIADLGGHVSVQSEAGKGSTVTISLPLTLAILDGQLIRVGQETYILPLVSIVETVQIAADEANAIAGKAELFKLRDDYVPIIRLHEMFDVEPDSRDLTDGLLVVVEANGQLAGIFVDDLSEQQQIVIKSLDTNYRRVPGLSGATILGTGNVALIIDVAGLLQLFLDARVQKPRHATAA